jgi:flagellar biosynthetic protein FlhB
MAMEDQEKVFEPTPKRRQEARKKGQIVQSREVISAVLLLGGTLWLMGGGPGSVAAGREFLAGMWSRFPVAPLTERDFYQLLMTGLAGGMRILLPISGLLAAAVIVSSVAQHGWLMTTETLTLKWSNVSPIQGFRRIFSVNALNEFAKTLFKFVAVGGVLYLIIRKELGAMVLLIETDPRQSVGTVFAWIVRLGLWAGVTIAVVGVTDYAFRWWQNERRLRMTRQEMKDEHRLTEGDPILRSRIRILQRERARKRMMADVHKADVVITNPTSLAVAVMYRHGEMAAPKVVAKGAGYVAGKIREVAREHGVPVIENKPLARALFKGVEVGGLIPSQFYRAVAEVLAYIYRLKGKQL